MDGVIALVGRDRMDGVIALAGRVGRFWRERAGCFWRRWMGKENEWKGRLMMNKRNFQKELDRTLERIREEGTVPSLFLHSCCAPCSSYVLEYLSQFFRITVFYYNPNIFPAEEYAGRVKEQVRLIGELNKRAAHPIVFVEGAYEPDVFFQAARGLEREPEGGARCTECFKLRLYEAARLAAEGGFDFFTTTLTISPLKDAERLNRIGEEAGKAYGVAFLNSDFKKKNGYKRSIELSREYQLYRQNYCGCVYSKAGADDAAGPGQASGPDAGLVGDSKAAFS